MCSMPFRRHSPAPLPFPSCSSTDTAPPRRSPMSRDKEKDAYRLRQRRLACVNIRFEIFLDDVENPNGEIVQNYLVVAPKIRTGDLITGVSVLPVMDGKLGLLRIYRHAIQRQLWEVPRGFVDPRSEEHTSELQ